jgi:hypothetical protein
MTDRQAVKGYILRRYTPLITVGNKPEARRLPIYLVPFIDASYFGPRIRLYFHAVNLILGPVVPFDNGRWHDSGTRFILMYTPVTR